MSSQRAIGQIDLKRLTAKLALAAVISTGLVVTASAPKAWAQAAQSAGRSDSDIQGDVVSALANSRSLRGQQITAATVEGDVTVSGNVRDEASRELAESLLYRVNGVRSVTNNLSVGNAAIAPPQGQANPDGNTAQSADPGMTQQDDPNYDPASQNLAPADPEDQAAAQQPPGQQAQYPQAQSYPEPQYPNRSNDQQPYGPAPQYAQQPQQPAVPLTLPAGTLLQVRTSEPLDATRVQPGQVFQATVAADVYQGQALAFPRGAVITGKVVAAQTNKGDVVGKQGLSLALTSVNLGGQVYTLPTDTWSGQGPGKGGYTAANTVGGAAFGALIGAIAGRGPGAAIGAGAGAALGAGASAATSGPRMYLPAEAVVNFHLAAPVTITPVSLQEAQRLASSTGYAPRPQLRPRYGYPYGAYPPPPPPAYYYGYRYPVGYYPYAYYRY